MTNATPTGARASHSLEFQGRVECQRGEAPLSLTLIGNTVHRPGEKVQLVFSTTAPADLPDVLNDARIDRLDERHYRIVSGVRQWTVAGIAHVHREVAGSFHDAVPSRPVPWHKRAFWGAALSIASTRLGQRMLFRSR